eukprot:g1243.t1
MSRIANLAACLVLAGTALAGRESDSEEVRRCLPGFVHAHDATQHAAQHAYMIQAKVTVPDGTLVASLRSRKGHYEVPFAAAAGVCAARGMSVCKPGLIQEAWQHKMDMCACGWADDGAMYYPSQRTSQFCGGAPGVHACGATTYRGAVGDVFCCADAATLADGPGYGTCTACPAGQYSDGSVEGKCVACAPGHYSASPAAQAADTCVPCQAGRFSAAQGAAAPSTCQACASGSHAAPGAVVCSLCPPGTSSTDTGFMTPVSKEGDCYKCGAGKYTWHAGEVACHACLPGKYSSTTGANKCNDCPAGMANRDTGATSETDCTPCAAGRWAAGRGNGRCLACSAGHYSSALGVTTKAACNKCEAGQYSAAGAGECAACAPGHYAAGEANLHCLECYAGRFAAASGSTSAADCVECPAGHFCTAATGAPVACPAGSHAPAGAANSKMCSSCAPGKYHESNAAGCVECGPGTYQDGAGASACEDCPAGTAQPLTGRTSLAECAHCKPGKYQPAVAKTFCVDCGKGFFQPRDGSTECVACELGTFGTARGAAEFTSACTSCEAGRYGVKRGAEGCSACPAGKTSATVGATSSDTCCGAAEGACTLKKDCQLSAWGDWGKCSQSCRRAGSPRGTQSRSRTVVSDGSGPGALLCSDIVQEDVRVCGGDECPVDCQASATLSDWSTCSKSCGGGVTQRTRKVVVHSAHGGKCSYLSKCTLEQCTAQGNCDQCLVITAPCNAATCDPRSLPRCHGNHVHCHIVQKHFAPKAMNYWVKNSRYSHGGLVPTNVCAHRWLYNYGDCHHCDSPAECNLKGIHKTMVVTHDRAHMHMTGQTNMFHCYKDQQNTDQCFCTCKMHPPCDAKQGMALRNKAIRGNTWDRVYRRQDCCNMCTNHPQCGSFTYKAHAQECTLYEGSPDEQLLSSSDPDFETTWSGCQSGDICQGDVGVAAP